MTSNSKVMFDTACLDEYQLTTKSGVGETSTTIGHAREVPGFLYVRYPGVHHIFRNKSLHSK